MMWFEQLTDDSYEAWKRGEWQARLFLGTRFKKNKEATAGLLFDMGWDRANCQAALVVIKIRAGIPFHPFHSYPSCFSEGFSRPATTVSANARRF